MPDKSDFSSGLYLTATPIGNLEDISLRALNLLRHCDGVICEDSRQTGKIFARHKIPTKPVILYHDHKAAPQRKRILARLAAGEVLALVSDAGTPLISDPGVKLVRAALEEGLPVFALPGPSAALTGLIISGLAGEHFAFCGFPPRPMSQRRKWLAQFASFPGALIFYEAAPRLKDSLALMAELYGARPAALARELTKQFEEVQRAPLPELAKKFAKAAPPKGEMTLIIGQPLVGVARLRQLAQRRQRGRKAFYRGHFKERLAALWLRLKGFRLLAQNWRSKVGEIDLIMRRGDLVIFVEVKARPTLDEAAHALRGAQKQRLRRAASAFLQNRPELASCTLRFDIVLFYAWYWQHLPNALEE